MIGAHPNVQIEKSCSPPAERFPSWSGQPELNQFEAFIASEIEIWNYDQSPEISAISSVIAALELLDVPQEVAAIARNDCTTRVPSFTHDAQVTTRVRRADARKISRCGLCVRID